MAWQTLENGTGRGAARDFVRVTWRPGEPSGRLRIVMGPDTAAAFGLQVGDRTLIDVGSGDDAGHLRLRRVEAGGYKWAQVSASSPSVVANARIGAAGWGEDPVNSTRADYRIEGGALIVALPLKVWQRRERLEDGYTDDPRAAADKGSPGRTVQGPWPDRRIATGQASS